MSGISDIVIGVVIADIIFAWLKSVHNNFKKAWNKAEQKIEQQHLKEAKELYG
jgi:hypothetical protein